jgi:hypothetical protein
MNKVNHIIEIYNHLRSFKIVWSGRGEIAAGREENRTGNKEGSQSYSVLART